MYDERHTKQLLCLLFVNTKFLNVVQNKAIKIKRLQPKGIKPLQIRNKGNKGRGGRVTHTTTLFWYVKGHK